MPMPLPVRVAAAPVSAPMMVRTWASVVGVAVAELLSPLSHRPDQPPPGRAARPAPAGEGTIRGTASSDASVAASFLRRGVPGIYDAPWGVVAGGQRLDPRVV